MPVPWCADLLAARQSGPGGKDYLKRNRIPAENGITLAQLRSTAQLLSRLCKNGLLRHTSEFSRASGDYGTLIKWTMINMHNINQEVIKKMIPEENSCSWVEICSRKPQKPKVFVSHNWSMPFRDFITAIELYKSSAGIGVHDAFFICTFANDQWNVDLGETLAHSPFYLALSGAEQVVLMLDKMGSALSRIWCVFEMNTTLKKGTTLSIATPLGIVGDKAQAASSMASSQVVEVLKSVDVSRAQATNPVDQRQIMNSIAGVQEEKGLRKDERGRKYLLDDRKSESGGTLGYQYEEDLIKDCPGGFNDINSFIQAYAEKSTSEGEKGCTVTDAAFRSLTLAQLRVMARRAESYYFSHDRKQWREEKKIKSWEDIKVFHLIAPFFAEFCEKRGKNSYMECVAKEPQPPEFLMSQAFTCSVKDLLASLEWHAEARGLPGSASYWFLPAAMLKDEADEYITTHCLPPSYCAMEYFQGCVVILDSKAGILSRALPALEIHGILHNKKVTDLACPSGALATTRPFGEGWEFGSFDRHVAEEILLYDVAKITGKVELGFDHAEMAKCMIAGLEYKGGDKAPETHRKYDDFNTRLRSKAFGPVLRAVTAKDALLSGSMSELRRALDTGNKSTALTSSSLRGLLGETALHIAAAGGNAEALELLLTCGANPNQQDNDGEAPLHYAAMSGNAESARVLLRFGADPTVESYFMDTATDVAEQSAATFLGVDTTEVWRLLQQSSAGAASPGGGQREASKDKDMILRAFEEFDSQWSGGITKDNLCSILCSLQPSISSDDIERLLSCMNMGDSEKIDYRTFISQLFS